MASIFGDFDIEQFWEPSEYAEKEYIGAPFTDEDVATLDHELGYELPASYIELMRYQNGGIPRKWRHRTAVPTSWASDHIAIAGIYAIGREPGHSLGGDCNTQFWIEEWGYPTIGVYFADCPSAGHDMVCLDYRECGPNGEPQVVHIDLEWDRTKPPTGREWSRLPISCQAGRIKRHGAANSMQDLQIQTQTHSMWRSE